MIMLSRLREKFRPRLPRARSWWIPAALLAVAPKCVACLLGYASLGAMLGIGGREMCGATDGHAGIWIAVLILPGAAAVVTRLAVRASQPSKTEHPEKASLDR